MQAEWTSKLRAGWCNDLSEQRLAKSTSPHDGAPGFLNDTSSLLAESPPFAPYHFDISHSYPRHDLKGIPDSRFPQRAPHTWHSMSQPAAVARPVPSGHSAQPRYRHVPTKPRRFNNLEEQTTLRLATPFSSQDDIAIAQHQPGNPHEAGQQSHNATGQAKQAARASEIPKKHGGSQAATACSAQTAPRQEMAQSFQGASPQTTRTKEKKSLFVGETDGEVAAAAAHAVESSRTDQRGGKKRKAASSEPNLVK
jgi:hypothetical protein